MVFAVSEELRRSRNIMVGVVAAATVYPTSLVCQALAGMFKGEAPIIPSSLVHNTIMAFEHKSVRASGVCCQASFAKGVTARLRFLGWSHVLVVHAKGGVHTTQGEPMPPASQLPYMKCWSLCSNRVVRCILCPFVYCGTVKNHLSHTGI